MEKQKIDRRIKYTKMIIKNSLLELLKEKPINKITVTQVCNLADINRGTFYNHYLDVYDLLEQIENELFDELYNDIKQFMNLKTMTMDHFIAKLFESVKQNKDICKIIFSENGNKDIIQKLFYVVHDEMIKEWTKKKTNTSLKTLEYIFSFLANGTISMVQKWIETGLKEKPVEIANIVNQIMENGVQPFLEEK